MSSTAEAAALVRRIAGPRDAGESIKTTIGRVARFASLSFTRTRDFWYADPRTRIHADEMDRLREVAARREAGRIVENLVTLRDRFAVASANPHSATLAALDGALRALGAAVGPVAVRNE